MQELSPLIDAAELHRQLNDTELRVVDCRFDLMDPEAGRQAWLNGHIPGSVYADLDRDLAGPVSPQSGRHPLPDAATACETFSRMGIDSDTNVVVYDAGNGGIAARAWWLLRWLGHARVALLDGGLDTWQQEGYALESGETKVERRTFTGIANDELVITTADIIASGDSIADLNIVDARAAARFRGEVEPIDPVAGHIPGTRNLPFTDALDANNRWNSRQELADWWARELGEQPEGGYSVMCGSGVTACHLVLSASLAGLSEPRVYVGSWSEWIRDPERSIARGEQGLDAAQKAAEPA
ncbi:MAG: sulfurtransferase [Gammaproteobacteria bacterium]|nr:MAG: sulfurtransferase [Gammaproteobacteria bacterium]